MEQLKVVLCCYCQPFKIPVKFIGVGEKMEDLLVFDKHEFVDSLFKFARLKSIHYIFKAVNFTLTAFFMNIILVDTEDS